MKFKQREFRTIWLTFWLPFFAIQAFLTSLYFSNSQNFFQFPEKLEQALKLYLKSTF